ncbi:MAG: AMP-dependent synthetase and ligase, partial [Acidobacteria bacterium]|nr:AMP-dependent synthetase and ligase [Acidobacteriota bacterium]
RRITLVGERPLARTKSIPGRLAGRHYGEMQNAPRTFNEQFENIVRRFPDRIAFRLKTPQGYPTVPYREAYRQARAVATGLLALGLKCGNRVAILSENRPEWVVTYLGIYLSGMIAVPLDTQISSAEWRRLMDDAEAHTVFVSGLLLQKFQEAVRDSRPPRRVISFDPLPGDRDARADLAGLIDWASTLPTPPALPECQPSDVVTIIYTSGTTGNPKGVMLTQSNIVGELQSIFGAIHADENDALLCLLPLQHVLASVINVLVPLYIGAQVVFADTLKRSEILQALEEAGITILATVPQFFYLFHNRIQEELSKQPLSVRRLYRAMLRLNRFSLHCLKLNLGKILFKKVHRSFGVKLRLFVSGGSSFDPRVAQDFADMGFTILQGYGLTETTGACAVTLVENNVVGSVGPALPGADIRILNPDETGTGEILIRGPMVMKGYYNNPAATEEVIQDGWFQSGDLGHLDPKGNLFVTGRKKEVIVLPNGKNIYPDELEVHYLQSPHIQEIAVIGVSDPKERGERLHAVVVPNFDYLKVKKIANAREALRDQIAGLSNQLPKYKRLMSYQVQGEPLPRTTTRKIKRLELKKMVESGQLQPSESPAPPAESVKEDQALMQSAVGQEVIHCLRETYHRDTVEPNMNLELDLGFDSMERVELLVSLQQTLNLELPDDFGAEILTVRDLIVRLEQQAGVVTRAGTQERQSWTKILSDQAIGREEEAQFRLSGTAVAWLKYCLLRLFYYLLFLPLLRLETHGLKQLPAQGPYLICPNHQSYLDPFVLVSTLPYRIFRNTFFVGYSVLFTSPIMRLVARLTNVVPVDPDAHLLRAMKAGAYGLRSGRILCIFPEGGRSYDGSLQEFKKGAAILSRELSIPIVPVAIQGTHRVWPRDSVRIRPHKVTIEFGKTLVPSPSDASDPYTEDAERLRNTLAAMLG